MNLLEKHPLTAKYQSLFNKFNVNTQLRLAHFFGQLQHESGLKPIVGYGYFYDRFSGQIYPYWMGGLQFNLLRF